ncbi:MAG: serine/threonine protein kinase [Verrucomicrobiae bacterium]|nr:serine/threonine protein kinase [Verrucomicrobiae bacterium]
MNKKQACARCGNAINGFAAGDLCAMCLLQDGLMPSSPPEGTLPSRSGATTTDRMGPPLPWDGTQRSSFGDYELIEEIARGGMGIVFKARHRSLNRVVALKMVLPGRSASQGFIERFHTEAEAAARLDHPHIVPVYEIGAHEGQHYYTMKLIEGSTLAARLATGSGRSMGHGAPASSPDPPSVCRPAEAAVLVAKVARAIHCAHQQGILHRDLKPANILIDQQGEPFVSDFGLARIAEKASDLTLTEAVLGTASYMAPEQAAGQSRQLTTSADIYSVGAILYELLAGRVPFRGPTPMETLRQVVERSVPSPRSIRPAVDPDLETICLKCLEKEPRDRYGSAEALADDLDRWLRHEPVLARPAGMAVRLRKWVRRRPLVAAFSAAMASVLGLAMGGVFWQWRRAEIRGDLLQQKADVMQRTLYAVEMKAARQAWNDARTGDVLALLRKYGPDSGLEQLRGFEWRQLWWLCHQEQATLQSHQEYICKVAFSPDGTRVAAAGDRDGVIRVWDVGSLGPVATLGGQTSWMGSLFFLDDNRTLAFDRNDGRLMLWDTTTARAVEILDGRLRGMWPLRLSPDGRWAAAVDRAQPRVLRVWEVATGRQVSELAGIAFHSPYMLDNRLLFSADGSTLAIALHDKSVRLLSVPDLTSEVRLVLTDHARCLALSPDGTLLAAGFISSPGIEIWGLASQQRLHTLRGPHHPPMFELRFSPDSTLLASSSYESVVALWSLAEPERERAGFKGHPEGQGIALAFSPDGRLLASGGRDGAIKLWNTDVSPASPLETALPTGAWQARFSPDGRTLAVAADGGKVKLFDPVSEEWLGTLEDPDDTAPPAEPYTPHYRPLALSPDGRLLAMGRGDRTVLVWDFETRQLRHRLTHDTGTVLCVAFAQDSKTLGTAGDDRTLRLWDARTGRQTGGLETRELVYILAFSPRGGVLAYGGWTRLADSQPVTLWNYETAQPVATLPDHAAPVSALAFSRNGQTLASGDGDGIVLLWNLDDLPSPRNLPVLSGHLGPISGLAFSPDEINLVATSFGGTARIWHLPAMLDAGDLSSRQNLLASAAFSPDGNTLALAGRERGVQLFRAVPFEQTSAQPNPD